MKASRLLTLFVLPGLAGAAAVPEWSCWRGPAGDGHYAHETGWTWEWPEGGPRKLWRVEVGLGYSGVAVSEGRAYTVGYGDKDNVVYCLDEETGGRLWTRSYPQKLMDRYHPGGPNATPAIDGDRLYVLSPEGLLSCFDKADGELRWRKDLPGEAGARVPTWGFASSPRVIGDRLFVNANRCGIAVDKNDGKVLWSSERAVCGYATPVPLRLRDRECLAVLGGDALRVVTQSGGDLLWEAAWDTRYGENSADPLIIGGRIYISTSWGMGAALFDPGAGGPDPVWRNREFQNHISQPVLVDGCLFGFHGPVHRKKDRHALRCVDAATGAAIWSQDGLIGSLLTARGKLVIVTSDGQLVVADASRDGYVERARCGGLGGRVWTPPTLHRGKLYVRDADGFVTCLDLRPVR